MKVMEIPAYAAELMEKLNQSGYECYVVGGAVRSALLGLPVHDYDLTSSALPEQMKEVFAGYKLIETGIKHGTVTVVNRHRCVEITTYRKDSAYTDHRHPDSVRFTSAIREDCARRDFTVNALCYHPKEGVLDFFHGRQDLNAKIIRCIGDPYDRFNEDALRILRALRFAAQLSFRIDPDTDRALHELKDSLRFVSAERIREEFEGFLSKLKEPSLYMEHRDVIEVFLPELSSIADEDMKNLLDVILRMDTDAEMRFAFLLKDTGQTREILERLKYSNRSIRRVTELRQYLDKPFDSRIRMRHFLNETSLPFEDHLAFRCAVYPGTDRAEAQNLYETVEAGDCYTLKQLAVSGNDLKAAGYSGKEIRENLARLLDAVMDDRLPNEKDALLHSLKESTF